MYPHPGGLQHQLRTDQTNPTLETGGLRNGDSPGVLAREFPSLHDFWLIGDYQFDKADLAVEHVFTARCVPPDATTGGSFSQIDMTYPAHTIKEDGDGVQPVVFRLHLGLEAAQPGRYHIEIELDGERIFTLPFDVEQGLTAPDDPRDITEVSG